MAKRKPSLYARMRKQLRRDIHQPSVMSCEDVYSIAWASGYRAGQRDERAKMKKASAAGPYAISGVSEFYWEIFDTRTNAVEEAIEKSGDEDEGRPYAEMVLARMNAKATKARKA